MKSRDKLTDLNTVFGTVNNTHIKESIGNLVQSIQDTTKVIEETSIPKVKVIPVNLIFFLTATLFKISYLTVACPNIFIYLEIYFLKLINVSSLQENTESLEKEAVRQKKWIDFLDQNTADLAAVDNLVKEKELELRKHYQDLEQKLKTSNS